MKILLRLHAINFRKCEIELYALNLELLTRHFLTNAQLNVLLATIIRNI